MSRYNFEKIYFLIVDDNRHMRVIISNILRGFGARHIHEAEDGSDALREMRTTPIDIVIADWVMEPLDGYDFVKLVRTAPDSPNPYAPIIMLTGYTEHHRVTGSRDIGVTEFLVKPVSAKALLSRIISVIDEPRPFVNVKHYTGPDRRRHRNTSYVGSERRGTQQSLSEVAKNVQSGTQDNLNQDDVEKLFAKK
jgi:two-component system chemotaxis response regulator CheY